ncbi:MAG: hydratase, partial [Pseudomonadota bacterium]|nr:hydratase [Pseudomonadota bacterium]
AQLIADNACAHEFILGPAAEADWRAIDLSQHKATIEAVGGEVHDGIGANVLGDPRDALLWLVQEITGLGLTIEAGQVVTTGTCAEPLDIEPGDEVIADFGALGDVNVSFDG